MGNRNVKLKLLLDAANINGDAVRAGTHVTGTVIVKVRQAVAEGPILMIVKGKEKTEVKCGKQNYDETHTIFEEQIELGRLGSTIGTHSFPFSVRLPESLPANILHYGNSIGDCCSIWYKCIVQHGNIKVQRYFTVSAASLWRGARKQCISGPKTEKIMSTGFHKKDMGSITFGAAVDDTRIGRGQYFVLSVACQNNSTVDIERVRFTLVEEFSWEASYRRSRKQNELIGRTTLRLPEDELRRKSKSDIQQEQRFGSLYPQIHDGLRSKRNSTRYRLYDCAHGSYGGKLITISHYIEVHFLTPIGFRDIATRIPITIGDYPLAEQTETEVAQAPLVSSTPVDDVDPIPLADVSVPFMP